MKKCPFNKMKACDPECQLFVENVRVYENGQTEVVKGCVFVMDHDEKRNQTQRLAMMHKEMGETKNATIFGALTMLGEPGSKGQILRMAERVVPLSLEENNA